MKIQSLSIDMIHEDILNNFNRYQKTTKGLVMKGTKLIEKDLNFIDEWDGNNKLVVIEAMRKAVVDSGFVLGAFDEKKLIGFIVIEGKNYGVYRELSYIHVSNEHRGKGIGSKLFKESIEHARQRGIKKYYIAAHPSIESQRFYRGLGCDLANYIIQEIFDKEPLDIQLECEI
ncbi:MAG: GNAT family N-acetyltransferase [Alkaliphilus sp.]|nr:GNAT family N-acetyltransferase [Alkaliphilus sp. AH-315-G20]PHS36547.1 MAG: GNAT family N-acetyltransferase [Alkaliphilus sp.]